MVVLYILAAILVVLLLLLLGNISVKVMLDDDFSVVVRYLFFKIKIPQENFKKQHINEKQSDNKTTEKKPKKNLIKTMIDEKGFVSAVGEIVSLVKSILIEFDKLLNHVRVKDFRLLINVANEDPAVTAIEYGSVCAAVFPVVRIIENKTKLDRKSTKIIVNSDFITGTSDIEFNVKIKLRLIFCVFAAVKVFVQLIKLKIKEKDVK